MDIRWKKLAALFLGMATTLWHNTPESLQKLIILLPAALLTDLVTGVWAAGVAGHKIRSRTMLQGICDKSKAYIGLFCLWAIPAFAVDNPLLLSVPLGATLAVELHSIAENVLRCARRAHIDSGPLRALIARAEKVFDLSGPEDKQRPAQEPH